MRENIKISDAITLAKRKNTSNWQAVIKAPDGKWRRIFTKTNDEQQATVFTWRDDADRYIAKYKRDVLRLYGYMERAFQDMWDNRLPDG